MRKGKKEETARRSYNCFNVTTKEAAHISRKSEIAYEALPTNTQMCSFQFFFFFFYVIWSSRISIFFSLGPRCDAYLSIAALSVNIGLELTFREAPGSSPTFLYNHPCLLGAESAAVRTSTFKSCGEPTDSILKYFICLISFPWLRVAHYCDAWTVCGVNMSVL